MQTLCDNWMQKDGRRCSNEVPQNGRRKVIGITFKFKRKSERGEMNIEIISHLSYVIAVQYHNAYNLRRSRIFFVGADIVELPLFFLLPIHLKYALPNASRLTGAAKSLSAIYCSSVRDIS